MAAPAQTVPNSPKADTRKPEMDLADRVQNEFSNCCARWEYCGTIFKHEIHWTEWLFFLCTVVSVILLIVTFTSSSTPISTQAFGILCGCTAFIALLFLWNIAKTKTLAALARKLKELVQVAKANTKKHEENNRQLAMENEKIQQSLQDFKQSVGLVDSAIKDIDQVEAKLNDLLSKHHALIEEQKILDEENKKFLELQEDNRQHLKKEQSKQRLRDQFSYADMNRDGSLSDGKEKAKMKEYIEKAGFAWPGAWDGADKGVRLWEVMVELDKQTASVFSFDGVKNATADNKKLADQVADLRKEVERVKPAEKKA